MPNIEHKITNGDGYIIPAQINGEDRVLKDTFDVISPSTDKVLWQCSSASIEDVAEAVTAAHAAFKTWRRVQPNWKRDIFLKAADIMEARAEELGRYMMEETAAGRFWSQVFNIALGAEILRDVAGRISTIVGMIPTSGEPGRSAMVWKEPYGVILGIAPWNAPYILGIRAVAYAVAAGNTAILKGSELSPRCFWAIGDVFREAGLPSGVLNVILHKAVDAATVTKAIIADPRVQKINFTGSTGVGKVLAELAGRYLKPILLELGGKAPAIVWNDANLELAAEECAKGAFTHSGQICMSTERILVHKDIAEEFGRQFKEAVQKMFGSSLQTLVNKAGISKNKDLISDTLKKGGQILQGRLDTATDSSMAPIILTDVTEDMKIYHTESFGPTVSLITISTEQEAIRISNDTEYGLTSAVFTEDLRTGFRFAKEIDAGAVHINGMTVHDETSLPHGGVKSSGFGRFGAVGLDEWVKTKTITYKD